MKIQKMKIPTILGALLVAGTLSAGAQMNSDSLYNTSLNFMLHQQRIQIFHSLSHDLIACSGYSRTRQ